MQKVTPFLWFDGKTEEAARFYTSIFKDSAIESISPMSATFRLNGLEFIALNAVRNTSSLKPSRSLSGAKHRTKSITIGKGSLRAARKEDAAGSKISLAFPGRSFLLC